MSKSDVKRIQTTLEVVTDNLDDLVNELLPDNENAKELVNHLYEVINDVCSVLENEIQIRNKVLK
jgi:choline kinase